MYRYCGIFILGATTEQFLGEFVTAYYKYICKYITKNGLVLR